MADHIHGGAVMMNESFPRASAGEGLAPSERENARHGRRQREFCINGRRYLLGEARSAAREPFAVGARRGQSKKTTSPLSMSYIAPTTRVLPFSAISRTISLAIMREMLF